MYVTNRKVFWYSLGLMAVSITYFLIPNTVYASNLWSFLIHMSFIFSLIAVCLVWGAGMRGPFAVKSSPLIFFPPVVALVHLIFVTSEHHAPLPETALFTGVALAVCAICLLLLFGVSVTKPMDS